MWPRTRGADDGANPSGMRVPVLYEIGRSADDGMDDQTMSERLGARMDEGRGRTRSCNSCWRCPKGEALEDPHLARGPLLVSKCFL